MTETQEILISLDSQEAELSQGVNNKEQNKESELSQGVNNKEQKKEQNKEQDKESELSQGVKSKEQNKEEHPTSSTPVGMDKNNFAAMNGVNMGIDATTKLQSSVPEPEEIVTTRTVSQNPVLKMGVIGGGMFIFVILIGGVINGSLNVLNTSTTKIEPPKNPLELKTKPSEIVDETGQTKTALALTSQREDFKKIRSQKVPTTPTPAPTTTATTTATTRTVASPGPPTRTIPQRTQPVTAKKNPLSNKIQTPTRIPTETTIKTSTVDPMQQWLTAANVGSFSSSIKSSDEELNDSGIEGSIGENPSAKNEAVQSIDYNAKRILVGSMTSGQLETPIAWGTGDNMGQNYLIKILKPLKASDDSEVLPVGSYLVAQLTNSNESGFAQLQGVSVLINSEGDMQEKKLPEKAVLVLSKDGSFLKAESRKGSDLGDDFMSAVIAGVAKAAEIQNRPSSQTNINSNGFSSSTTSNEDKNFTAAFGEGAFNNILESIKASNQRRSQELNDLDKVFVIDAGKTVQIFINQTITL